MREQSSPQGDTIDKIKKNFIYFPITLINNPNICIFFMNSDTSITKKFNNLTNQGKTYYLSSKMVLPELNNLENIAKQNSTDRIKIGYMKIMN